ncbi:MAG: hypothetical protein JXA22_04560 [Candidatus Thermoplasmatota archaeon]|nr:hypothetical protein [Candidatus Thermoplasmatota archaeon]
MNYKAVLILLLTVLLIPFLGTVKGDAALCLDHYSPLDPVEGDVVQFYVVGSTNNGSGILSVELRMDNRTQIMTPAWEGVSMSKEPAIIYSCSMTVLNPGTHNITYTAILTNGSSILFEGHTIHVNGTEDQKKDTIFGLPKTYFAISVIFITVIIIFLTWSYFKGKKIQKQTTRGAEPSGMVCSACGATISQDDERCPGCNAEFEEEEHICGACGGIISEKDMKCPHCNVKLKEKALNCPESPEKENDPDLLKIKGEVDMTGKVRCKNCSAVYMKSEGSCPECGK